jgi:hypothetical protein
LFLVDLVLVQTVSLGAKEDADAWLARSFLVVNRRVTVRRRGSRSGSRRHEAGPFQFSAGIGNVVTGAGAGELLATWARERDRARDAGDLEVHDVERSLFPAASVGGVADGGTGVGSGGLLATLA